jgi:hypothetical protein
VRARAFTHASCCAACCPSPFAAGNARVLFRELTLSQRCCLRLQEAYEQIKRQMIEALAPDRRGQMEAAFEKLMVGVLRNLESRNRDKFTQNLTAFRQEVKAFLNA